MFQSVMRTGTTCQACGFVNYSDKERPNIFCAEIPRNSQTSTIEQAIEAGLKTVASSYKCDECKEEGDALRQTRFRDAPEVLIVAIPRVTVDSNANTVKSFEQISFDDYLDLTNSLEGNARKRGEQLKYKLSSVISHQGKSFQVGHYVSNIKLYNGEWKCLNDDRIEDVRQRLFFKGGGKFVPYLLVYTREPSYSEVTAAEFDATKTTDGLTVQPAADLGDDPPHSQSPHAQAATAENLDSTDTFRQPKAPPEAPTGGLESQDDTSPQALSVTSSAGAGNASEGIPKSLEDESFRWDGQPAEIEVRVTMGDMLLSGILQGVLRKAYKRPADSDEAPERDRNPKRVQTRHVEPGSVKATGVSDTAHD